MSQKTILALDLGTQLGWAMQVSGGVIYSGTESFKPGRYEGGGMRYLRFRRWLDEVEKSSQDAISAVYFEEVRRHMSTDSAHVYGGFLATLTAWCESNGIPYQGVPVGTWKKSACEKGNASKEDVIAAMKLKGHRPKNDDESDALAILHWALEQ
jgi:Holliday junction resolvasome RuvABC endonuclease subunit